MKEFASPFQEYKQTRSDSKQALLRRQIAEGGPLTASRAAEKLARLKLNDESHSRLGTAIGAGIGVVPGFVLGSTSRLPHSSDLRGVAWGALTGLAGAGIGQAIGGSIRKNKDKNLSANLKPALRELAARSGRIVEFGDDEANGAVIAALKDVASADETSAQREFARGDFLRQAVGKYSDVAPAVVPGVSPSVVGPRGKEWRSQFLLWARKRAAKQLV